MPARAVCSMTPPRETYDILDREAEIEMDLVTHDAGKYCKMLVGRNGYVLEQVFSQLVIHAEPAFEELKDIALRCITRHHRHHFRSFAKSQWNSVAGSSAGTVKGLLYTYRPLLAGIYLMTERNVESNLRTLNERFRLSYIDELIERKVSGGENQALGDADLAMHGAEFERFNAELEDAAARSGLPDQAQSRDELDALLVRLRMSE